MEGSFKTPLFIALIGLIGTGIGASIGGYFNIQLEKEKLRSSLILKAVETEDQQSAIDFLKFLDETQLVEGLDITIEHWKKNPEIIPLRPQKETQQSFTEGIYHESRDIRRKTLQRMINEDAANPDQIYSVIEALDLLAFKKLDPPDKVNAVFFLNKTNFTVWTPEMKQVAKQNIDEINAAIRRGSLIVGPQAKTELKKLENNLSHQ